MAYTLPPLGYAYDALEPHFDTETMTIHHSKHHATYVATLNAALEDQHALSSLEIEDLIAKIAEAPEEKRKAIRNAGGGHANHSLFWKGLKKGTRLEEQKGLMAAIEKEWGSVAEFKAGFETAAKSVFGSGWAWLVKTPEGGLRVVTTANQDSPLMGQGMAGASGFPVLALDVWEHAYYLKYRNVRPDYIKAFWEVCDWEEAGRRFEMGGK